MNKMDLIERLAKEAGIPKTQAAVAINTLVGAICEALTAGDRVTISDFGTFTVSSRTGYEGRNPRTGEAITIPARKIPVFRAGKGLKTALNR